MNYINAEVNNMLKIDMEFKKGILFIRLDGSLNKRNIEKFSNEVIPVILKHGLKYVVVNLDKVNTIDVNGIESLMELNEIVSNLNGKTTLCSLTSKDVKTKLKESDYNDKFFETSNELTALGVMKL